MSKANALVLFPYIAFTLATNTSKTEAVPCSCAFASQRQTNNGGLILSVKQCKYVDTHCRVLCITGGAIGLNCIDSKQPQHIQKKPLAKLVLLIWEYW